MTRPTPAREMLRTSRAYAEFDAFLDRLRLDSPFGRDAKASFGFCADAAALKLAWDDTQALLAHIAAAPASDADRLRHHLARLVRMPQEPRACFDQAELLAVKRFLHHYAAVRGLVGEALAERFGLPAGPSGLATELNRGRQSPETFYLADEYSPELTRARAELRAVDASLAAAGAARAEQIRLRWGLELASPPIGGLALGASESAIVPADTWADAPIEAAALLAIEPYDAGRVLVRPLPSGVMLQLAERREVLAEAERAAESASMERLSALISPVLPELVLCARAVGRLDLAFARARLALDGGLVRPRLGEAIAIAGGRLPAVADLCDSLGAPYIPLDLRLDGRPAVLFGSNMGGKTVVLKTVAFLQLAAQHGLFVPADAYTTVVTDAVVCVGEVGPAAVAQGLSGFGREVRRLAEALATPGRRLLLFDEFARTTGSREAEALIGAVAARLADQGNDQALFSTHFRCVPRSPGVRFLRMRGLRDGGAGLLAGGRPLADRIADINRHMDYTLTDDDGVAAPAGSDALAIAAALGLDGDLVREAHRLLDVPPESLTTPRTCPDPQEVSSCRAS